MKMSRLSLWPSGQVINLVLLFAVLNIVNCAIVGFDENEINRVVEDTFACHNNPGIAVSIVKDGEVLFSKGYGVKNLETQANVTNSTLFGIASLSKSFAATLLVKLLYEKTNLTVDSKVHELLGHEFQMPDQFRTQETTFADLMAHRTGVPSNNRIRFDTNLTRKTLPKRLHLLPSPDPFRVKYYYSNLMYGLVTRLAEIIGGKSWEQLITEHLFHPLGMNRSTFATVADFGREDIAVAYVTRRGEFLRVHPEFSRKWAELAGSGSLLTSADEMAAWMNFHLLKGQNGQGQQVMENQHLSEVHKSRFLVSRSTGKDTRVPQFPVTASEDIYAHGLRKGFYRGYERMTHSGSTLGYRAFMSLLPRQKIGIFTVLTGQDDGFAYRVPLHMYLMDKLLGLEPWLNVSTICSYPEPWRPKSKSSSSPTFDTNVTLDFDNEQYEGTYHNVAYGYLKVHFNQTLSTLVLSYGWGKWQLFLQPSKKDNEKFYGRGLAVTSTFNISPIYFVIDTSQDGKARIIGLKATAFEPKVPPVFDKMGTFKSSNGSSKNNLAGYLMAGLLVLMIL